MRITKIHSLNATFSAQARIWFAALLLVFSQAAVTAHSHDQDTEHAPEEICQVCWHAQHLDASETHDVNFQSYVTSDQDIVIPSTFHTSSSIQTASARAPPTIL